MTRQPAAYIRRSEEGGITRADEIAKLRELAHREGHNGDLLWYDDWGHSADESKKAQRELDRLIADIRQGRIGTVYAGKMDRLARSVAVFARFAAAAREHDVRLVTVAEGDMSEATVDSDPFKWAARQFMVTMAEMELRTIKARVRRAKAVREDRGDEFGSPPYGYRHMRDETGRIVRIPDPDRPIEPLVAAYREAGSILGACRKLEDDGVPAPRGGTYPAGHPRVGRPRWATSALTRILENHVPELLPSRSGAASRRELSDGRVIPVKARREPSRAVLARLLRCPFCEKMLTPNVKRGQYYCAQGPRDRASHPRYAVREADLLPWVKAEAARLALPADEVEVSERNDAERSRLERLRMKWLEQYAEDLIDKAERNRQLTKVDDELERLDSEQVVIRIEPIDWSWPPEALNMWLRSVFTEIQLDANLHPLRAEWRVPEWREP